MIPQANINLAIDILRDILMLKKVTYCCALYVKLMYAVALLRSNKYKIILGLI